MKEDPDLWSGCISHAFTETALLEAFQEAGFHGISILSRDEAHWQTIEGIEFRSVTVAAWEGKQGPCIEKYQAVIYKGPWKSVSDDNGHTLSRGERMTVCEKTFNLYRNGTYADQLVFVEPYDRTAGEEDRPFDCSVDARRPARVTKGDEFSLTEMADGIRCGPDGCC